MGYLQCEKCGGYYELHDGESLDDFAHCSCGGNLIYTENIGRSKHLEDGPNESGKVSRKVYGEDANNLKSKDMGNSGDVRPDSDLKEPTDKIKKSDSINEQNHTNQQLSKLGLIIMFVGFFLLIFAFFYPFLFFGSLADNPDIFPGIFVQTVWIYLISIVLMILGTVIFVVANLGRSSGKKQAKPPVIAEYLQELPDSYTIFHKVRIPQTRSLISHLIIGPNGIFIIQSRSMEGNFIIRDDEWWRAKANKRTKALLNPGKLVKMNSIDLKMFLESHNVNVDYVWITPIVAFPQDRYTIEEPPLNYNLMPPEDVSSFILREERTTDPDIMMRVIALIPHRLK